jgi:hypothetical protein
MVEEGKNCENEMERDLVREEDQKCQGRKSEGFRWGIQEHHPNRVE